MVLPVAPWEWALTFLGAASFALAAWSLVDVVRQRRRVARLLARPSPPYRPPAAVIVACRGVDAGLAETVRRVLTQDYGPYRVIFALNEADDPAHAVIRDALRTSHGAPASVVFGGPFDACSGKVAALRAAVAATTEADEVLAFLDSDARPGRAWLRTLVAPLADPDVGASTGYRWYVSPRGGFWSAVQAAWSALGVDAMLRGRYAFVWGGSYAMRRAVFETLGIAAGWRDAFSDDLVVTRALQDAGSSVRFVPSCVLPTFEDTDLGKLLDWTARQFAIVWIYAPDTTRFAAWAFAAVHLSGLLGLLLLLAATVQPGFLLPGVLFATHIPATVLRSIHRHETFRRAMAEPPPEMARDRWRFALASFVVPLLTLYDYLRVRRSRRIEWRGTTYELLDRNRVRVIR